MRSTIAVSVLVAIGGCARPACRSVDGPPAFDKQHPEVPFVMFHRYPSYPGPEQEPVAGPVVALWSDGRMVRVAAENAIGKQYLQGRLAPERLTEALAYVQAHPALLRLTSGDVVQDAASESLGIRLAGVCVLYAETVGDFGDIRHNADVAALRKYLMSLPMEDSHPTSRPWVSPPDDWYAR